MSDPQSCRQLWQGVIYQAFVDATYDGLGGTASSTTMLDKRRAHDWITECGRDFRQVCSMAGMDAEFLSHAYRSGRISRGLLKGDPRRSKQASEKLAAE